MMDDNLKALIAGSAKNMDKERQQKVDDIKAEARAKRRREQEEKQRRIQEEIDHFNKLISDIRYRPSLDVQLAKAFGRTDDKIPEDTGFMAVIGVTPYHNVFGGDPNRWLYGGKGKTGNWRNASRITEITHIAVMAYTEEGIEREENTVKLLAMAQSVIPLIMVFDNNGKVQYDSFDEIKADIAHVLSKIYKLPNPLTAGGSSK